MAPGSPRSGVALDALRLQNGYAYAVDTRSWDYFRTLFTADVTADYLGRVYRGMDDWLDTFIPTHAAFAWTRHEMSNHVVGDDADGVWAVCYGFIEWIARATPERMNTARVLYRDRLVERDGGWLIARRTLDNVMLQAGAPLPGGVVLPAAISDLADNA